MKKVLWSILLLSAFLIPHNVSAKTYSFGGKMPVTITTTSATSATIHIVFPVVNNLSYQPGVCVSVTKTTCEDKNAEFVYNALNYSLYKSQDAPPGNVYKKALTWDHTLTNLDPSKAYWLIVTGPNAANYQFFTGVDAQLDTPVLTSKKDGDDIIVSGAIDTNKYPQWRTYNIKATLTISRSQDLSNPIITGLQSTKGTDTDSGFGISTGENSDFPAGTYYWRIKNLLPSTIYYFQGTLTKESGLPIKSAINSVNSSDGTTITPGTASAQADFNQRNYTFLSDNTGKTVLPDPDVCAQQQQDAIAHGTTPPKCSINDYLDLGIQIIIGLCGVVLVLRLMFEGYQYMVSDVPFLKAKAKSGFFTALTGLLLALASYLILNTINPKLVSESINVQQLAIGVTAPDTDSLPILQNSGAPTSGAVGACTAGITTVTVGKSSFVACSTYNGIPIATNLKNMLTAAYAAGITLQGGGFRSAAEQTKLRIAHCNGDISNPNAACEPPTAPVGHSNHESGLAFDFTCNGSSAAIPSQSSPCFIWLKNNAATYGFKNFAKEPWHWSWDGR